ncbi:hypothetical protein [Pseudoduganella sp. R-43]|uniref:hypothetical protein n=1 Tax=unclassified Pseudoduganella TaxID=2637179 RepID=UPI003CE915F7
MNSTCLIFFPEGSSSLQQAEQELTKYDFDVRSSGGSLFAKRLGSQEFKITLVQLPHVLLEAKEIGQGSEHEQFLSKCGSRFELFISDLDAAMDEINSLMEAQGALQDASSGYLFTPWNGQIMKPWNAS